MLVSARRSPAPSRTGGSAGSTRIADLVEDGVHDAGGEKDLPIRNGYGGTAHDGAVEGLDQILHAGLHVEIPRQERPPVRDHVSQVLPGQDHRRDGLPPEGPAPTAPERDTRRTVLGERQSGLWAVSTT